jgi:uncharacterized protein YjbJ (UPF0337 family)
VTACTRRWDGRHSGSRFAAYEDSLQRVGFSGTYNQEHAMNKDQVKGRTKEVEGKINEVTGKVVGDRKLEVKGKAQQIGGEAQAKFGDLKQDVKNSSKR